LRLTAYWGYVVWLTLYIFTVTWHYILEFIFHYQFYHNYNFFVFDDFNEIDSSRYYPHAG